MVRSLHALAMTIVLIMTSTESIFRHCERIARGNLGNTVSGVVTAILFSPMPLVFYTNVKLLINTTEKINLLTEVADLMLF